MQVLCSCLLPFRTLYPCRLANTPLETAYELRVVAAMTQLVQLELGIIFDGSSAHHDVPRAVEGLGELQRLQVRGCDAGARHLRHLDVLPNQGCECAAGAFCPWPRKFLPSLACAVHKTAHFGTLHACHHSGSQVSCICITCTTCFKQHM